MLKRSDLKEGMDVLANYNVQEPKKRGIWVRGTVDKVTRKEVVSTLYVGVDLTPVPDCKLLFPDEIMKLEDPVKPADRSEEQEVEMNTAVERKNPPECEVCQDNDRKKCKECDRNDPDNILIQVCWRKSPKVTGTAATVRITTISSRPESR